MFNGVEMNVNFSMKSAVAMLRIKSRISCIVPSSPDKLDDGKGRGGADGEGGVDDVHIWIPFRNADLTCV